MLSAGCIEGCQGSGFATASTGKRYVPAARRRDRRGPAPKVRNDPGPQRIVSLLIFQSTRPCPHQLRIHPWVDCRYQIPIDVMIPMLGKRRRTAGR